MATIDELPEIDTDDITDDDYIVLFDLGAVSEPARRVTVAQFLNDVLRSGSGGSFGSVTIATLISPSASIANLGISNRLTFASGNGISNIRLYEASETFPTVNAGASDTVDITVTGVTTNDYINLTFGEALPDGMIVQAWPSAADTVQLKIYNASSGNISGTDYAVRLMIIQRYTPA